MKIAILIKQVPGSESSLPISVDQKWVEESAITYVMNPPDNYALEEALLIREKLGKGEVVVISMGPDRVQKVIREGLAKGADRGIHLKEKDVIEVGAAALDKRVSDFAKKNEIGGMEFLSCIPGSIGGAIIMNSGCYGSEISKILVSI